VGKSADVDALMDDVKMGVLGIRSNVRENDTNTSSKRRVDPRVPMWLVQN
jgi:hypothetical protein